MFPFSCVCHLTTDVNMDSNSRPTVYDYFPDEAGLFRNGSIIVSICPVLPQLIQLHQGLLLVKRSSDSISTPITSTLNFI